MPRWHPYSEPFFKKLHNSSHKVKKKMACTSESLLSSILHIALIIRSYDLMTGIGCTREFLLGHYLAISEPRLAP